MKLRIDPRYSYLVSDDREHNGFHNQDGTSPHGPDKISKSVHATTLPCWKNQTSGGPRLQEVSTQFPPLEPRTCGESRGLARGVLEGRENLDDPRTAPHMYVLAQMLVLPGLCIHEPACVASPLIMLFLANQRDASRCTTHIVGVYMEHRSSVQPEIA